MSKITDAYNATIVRLETLFPSASGWVRLPNPYKPEENPDLYLKQGWGFVFGPASNTQRTVCQITVERSVTIVLARKVDSLENDAVSKQATELQLLEDQFLLIQDLEQDSTINGTTMYTRWVEDGGLEYIRSETDKFLMVRTTVAIEYIENYT